MPARSNTGPAAASSSSVQSARLTFICLAIATVFTLCWLPLMLALMLLYTVNLAVEPMFAGKLLRWLTILACFNSCVNPIIYALMWRPFRTALREVSTTLFFAAPLLLFGIH